MAVLETFFTVCGRQWEPSRQDLIAGVWKTCPGCRDAETPSKSDRNAAESGTNPPETGRNAPETG